MSIKLIQSLLAEKSSQFPELKEDFEELAEMGIDEINDEGSEQGEYDQFQNSVDELIDEYKCKGE